MESTVKHKTSLESDFIFEIWAWVKQPNGKYDIVLKHEGNDLESCMAKATEMKSKGCDCLKIYWR